jgi:predicted RNase H-like nuclease (RuvC/YqgF family)
MRLREKQLQERLSRYEQSIVDYENEKKALYQTIKQKDEDIMFIKSKYEETNALWHQENLEKQKLEAIIE